MLKVGVLPTVVFWNVGIVFEGHLKNLTLLISHRIKDNVLEDNKHMLCQSRITASQF